MRLQRRKRPAALLDVFARARKLVGARRDLSLDIVGDGPELARVERRCRAMGSSVRLHGRVEAAAIAELYARSDAFLLPTRLESFGIAALEARSAGLPVVALRDTGVADFVAHGYNGLLAYDDSGLARAIADLALDPELADRIRAHNLTVTPPFGWNDVATATLAQYARAIRLQQLAAARATEEGRVRRGTLRSYPGTP
jgi:glycosyltransferase involved in cell wall biosynthesis